MLCNQHLAGVAIACMIGAAPDAAPPQSENFGFGTDIWKLSLQGTACGPEKGFFNGMMLRSDYFRS
jgi:hypothetical protein